MNVVTLSVLANVRSNVISVGRLDISKRYCKEKSVATGANAQSIYTCYDCGEQGHTRNRCLKKVKFSSMLDIDPIKIDTNYEVELADGRVVSINTILKSYALKLLNHLFKINLMLIKLGTFDVIIVMDWIVKPDIIIVYGEKIVCIRYVNKALIVESNKGMSRLKVISCIKARKYIERGCHLFWAHVTEKKSKEKRLEDVPVICDFPEFGTVRDERVVWIFARAAGEGIYSSKFITMGSTGVDITSYALKKRTFQLLHLELDMVSLSFKRKRSWKAFKIILDLLKKERLYAKFSKCDFWLDLVQFLGHVINRNGVHVDPAKIRAIRNWVAPPMPTEVRQFLGSARYYQRKELNIRQHRWIESLSDYDCEICYHPEKANVVADTLSHKERIRPLRVRASVMTIHNDLPKRILEAQKGAMKKERMEAENLGRMIKQIFEFCPDGTRCFRNRVWFLRHGVFRNMIMHESHKSKPSGLPQPPEIPVWKWEKITMDFVSRLLRTSSGYDSIWVIIDRMTKSTHFLLMKKMDSMEKLTQLYLKEIVWISLDMSTAYHPQMNGQSERTIQMLEDMLRVCVIDFRSSWDRHQPLVEFSYNNSYHASIKAAPFEALYGRKCRLPVGWSEVGDNQLTCP
nr:putative reverse transcriptase domain-containing protein [Tanacetum cinerariifolium]